MTPTGSDRVKAAFGQSVFHVYLPYDLPDAILRFIDFVKPKMCIVIETIWPNLIKQKLYLRGIFLLLLLMQDCLNVRQNAMAGLKHNYKICLVRLA